MDPGRDRPLVVVVVVFAQIGHIFATMPRIDLKLVYSERSRRTTSEYTTYMINLAREGIFSKHLMIFRDIFSKSIEIY